MDLMAFNEDQETLRSTVRQFFAAKAPESETRRLMATDDGYDRAVWGQMAGQLGLVGLAIPESYGGQGYTAIESMIVLEEAGRALLCGPLFATVGLAVPALLSSQDGDAAKRYLPAIASGESIATLALIEPSGRFDQAGMQLMARVTSGEHLLTGGKTYVIDGGIADIILVVAKSRSGISLYAVHGDAPGLSRGHLQSMDQTRKLATLEFRDTPAQLIGAEGAAWPVIERSLQLACVALAAEQVGGAQAVLDMCVAYGKTRYQFGRPIGSFQTFKHRCADLLVTVESARSAAYNAAWVAVKAPADLPLAASLAKAVCSDAFARVASDGIQLHGGIAFTWEHAAHLYLKRAKSMQIYLGGPGLHREQVARLLSL